MSFALLPAEPASLGLNASVLDRLSRFVEGHIAEGRYPGAQIAIARHGKLAFDRTYGLARVEPVPMPARRDTLWLLYSNTKVITAAAIWLLVEDGALTFHDTIALHIPEFARHGKGDITLLELLTHRAGFPNAGQITPAAWADHELLRREVCEFVPEWPAGTRVRYHTLAAHWVAAVLIEAVAKTDYRAFIRARLIEPLGLGDELHVGLPDDIADRAAEMHMPSEDGRGYARYVEENSPAFRRAGVPGAGGFATARAMAAFYQMLVGLGQLNGRRILSPRMVQYVTRNFTGDLVDEYMGMPMHRGIGPHSRGSTPGIRGLGSLGSPSTFGHGGVGSSYCWADPDSGLSFAYVTNNRVPDPWHSRRLDIVSSMAHAAIEDVSW